MRGALMRLAHAARAIGCTTRQLRDWIRRGAVKGIKVGGQWWVPRTTVARLLDVEASTDRASRAVGARDESDTD